MSGKQSVEFRLAHPGRSEIQESPGDAVRGIVIYHRLAFLNLGRHQQFVRGTHNGFVFRYRDDGRYICYTVSIRSKYEPERRLATLFHTDGESRTRIFETSASERLDGQIVMESPVRIKGKCKDTVVCLRLQPFDIHGRIS